MTKNAEKQKGITLVALIITIIVMIILVAVTLNIALGENGLIGKAKTARMKQEEQSILEEIIALATWDKNGNIEANETYERVESNFTTEEVSKTSSEIKFKVQGKYGKYGYKIAKKEIAIIDKTNPEPPEIEKNGKFTFNKINNYIAMVLKDDSNNKDKTDEEIKEIIPSMLEESGLLQVENMGGNQTVSSFSLPADIFWAIIGKSYSGQYGVKMTGNSQAEFLTLKNSDNIIKTDSDKFSELYTGSTNKTTNSFIFYDAGKEGIILYLSRTGTEFSAIVSSKGDESKSILSWNKFLEQYGDIEFTFSKSEESSNSELKESYFIDENFSNLKTVEEQKEEKFIYRGEEYTEKLIAEAGYTLPTNIEINMDGQLLTDGTDYTWSISKDETTGNEIGTITIKNVKGQLYISAEGKSTIAYIYYNTNNIDTNNLPSQTTIGQPFTAKFIAYDGYVLPRTIEVTINGEIKTEGIDYTWDQLTGEFTTIGNVIGDMSIIIIGEEDIPSEINQGDIITNKQVLNRLGTTGGTYTGDWQVIGIEEDKIKLVSTESVATKTLGVKDEEIYKKDLDGNITQELKDEIEDINADGSLEIEKVAWSYIHSIDTLNAVAQKCTGIPNARSIKIEDIYEILGEENVTKDDNYGKTFKYEEDEGKIFSYEKKQDGTWNYAHYTYMTRLTFVNNNVASSIGRLEDAKINTGSVEFTNNLIDHEINDDQKTLLGTLATDNYWIASTYVSCRSGGIDFGLGNLIYQDEYVGIGFSTILQGDELFSNSGCQDNVRAVIYIDK